MSPLFLNPRFTERFWHLSKYFFALANRQNDYLNTFFTRDTAPYKIYAKNNLFYLQFGFFHPTQIGKQHHPQSKSSEDASQDAKLFICATSLSAH